MTSALKVSEIDFREVTLAHPIWRHEFLHYCRNHAVTRRQLEILAVQMYKFCSHFGRILAGIIAQCPDFEVQAEILENLRDEMGGGDERDSHPALFRRFTRALGIDDVTLESAALEPETQDMIETYMSLAERYGYLAAIGAICFASEGIVSALYSQILGGIHGVDRFPRESLAFFEQHIQLDEEHADRLAALVFPRLRSPQDVAIVRQAIDEALDARYRFFDCIQRQIH